MFEQAHFINIAYDSSAPCNDLPLLPPSSSLGNLETVRILKACVQARSALATLNQICRHFPVPSMLWRVYPLLEAHWSSRIDGSDTDVTELFKIPLDLSPEQLLQQQPSVQNTAIARVLAERGAIELGYERVRERPVDVSMLLELASAIECKPMPVRRGAGVPLRDPADDQILFTPPQGAELLQRQLGNWEQFIHVEAGDLDPLVLIAVAHYQLCAIQPFGAPAGALARLLDGLLMAEENLLSVPVLGLSTWLYHNRQQYIRLQTMVSQEQRWQDWLLFFLNGISTSAQVQAAKLEALGDLMRHTREHIERNSPKVAGDALMELIFTDPCLRIQNLVRLQIARRQTASVYLKKLCELGVLEECPYGKEKLFVHTGLIRLLHSDSHHYSNYVG